MKIVRIDSPFPAVSIENFIPSESLVKAAAASFEHVENWVKYGHKDNQVQYCSRLGRENVPPAALAVLDYIAINFDPNKVFNGITSGAFPDMSHYGGGMMITPNSNGEGGYLEMHVDASTHGIHQNWKREYSAILCISEVYDSSFDLVIHNGEDKHTTIPYKFNSLNVFKCSSDSWHGLPEITKGLDRKTLGVMYWSIMGEDEAKSATKARFNKELLK